jgi:ribosomal-protein-alanine N-acetyltransferase
VRNDLGGELAIRPATAADVDAIDEIEQHSFKVPWPRATFEDELAREWARIDVAHVGGTLVAFCNYWLVIPAGAQRRDQDAQQAAAGGELHILAIATQPDHRGRGIAGRLLAHVLDVARRAGCSLATLEVRRSNSPAIALYEHAGFKTVHVRAHYYQDDGEDALVMLRGLS